MPHYRHEKRLLAVLDGSQGGGPEPRFVCGVDEAGRGPLAGPVIAAAVILQHGRIPRGLNDAASIVAKVTRDRMMVALHEEHPGYNWRSNKGYGTADHLAGLKTCGVTIHHRRSFSPVHHILYGDESGTQLSNALIPRDS